MAGWLAGVRSSQKLVGVTNVYAMQIKAQAPIQSSRSTNENIAAANSEKELVIIAYLSSLPFSR